jgi:hypothetical protein
MTRRWTAIVTCAALVSSLVPWPVAARGRPGKPATDATGNGSLILVCLVDGAEFVIDEGARTAIRGTTPVRGPVRLRPGTHTIRVSREGYLPFSEVFDIAAGQSTEVEADLVLYSGTLKVLATPEGVEVQIDGGAVARAPVEARVSIGDHVVRLSRPGYVEEVRRVAVRTGQATELAVRMVAEAEAAKAASKTVFWKQWWFWTVIGVVAAGAVATGVAVPLTRDRSHPLEPDALVPLR